MELNDKEYQTLLNNNISSDADLFKGECINLLIKVREDIPEQHRTSKLFLIKGLSKRLNCDLITAKNIFRHFEKDLPVIKAKPQTTYPGKRVDNDDELNDLLELDEPEQEVECEPTDEDIPMREPFKPSFPTNPEEEKYTRSVVLSDSKSKLSVIAHQLGQSAKQNAKVSQDETISERISELIKQINFLHNIIKKLS